MGDNERLCAMKPHLRLKRFLPQVWLEPWSARSALGSDIPEKFRFGFNLPTDLTSLGLDMIEVHSASHWAMGMLYF